MGWEWRREEDKASQGPNRKQTGYSHEDDLQRVLSQRAGPMAVGGKTQELRARGSRAYLLQSLPPQAYRDEGRGYPEKTITQASLNEAVTLGQGTVSPKR